MYDFVLLEMINFKVLQFIQVQPEIASGDLSIAAANVNLYNCSSFLIYCSAVFSYVKKDDKQCTECEVHNWNNIKRFEFEDVCNLQFAWGSELWPKPLS